MRKGHQSGVNVLLTIFQFTLMNIEQSNKKSRKSSDVISCS